MRTDPPDPIAEVHRLLDPRQTLMASWVLPPLLFGAATVGGLLAELPEVALALGIATLPSWAVAAVERLRKSRAVGEILEDGRLNEESCGS